MVVTSSSHSFVGISGTHRVVAVALVTRLDPEDELGLSDWRRSMLDGHTDSVAVLHQKEMMPLARPVLD